MLFESVRKKVIGKPCEGKLHARFDEGVVGESPLLYSALVHIKRLIAGILQGVARMQTKYRELQEKGWGILSAIS
jgi:hypothetical protein